MPKSVQKASDNALDIVNRFVAQEQRWNGSVSIDNKCTPSKSQRVVKKSTTVNKSSPTQSTLGKQTLIATKDMNAVMAKKALLVEISKKKNKGSNDSDSEEFYESF